MAHVKFDTMIPWYLLKRHFEQQQRSVDSKLRHAVEPEAAMLRGKAQFIEQLMNLPETLETLASEDERAQKEKASG